MNQACKPRILVVDDDAIIVELLSMVLDRAGYEVLTAGDGVQAISILQSTLPDQSIDILMVDLMMPVMDGLRFMRWLRTELKCSLPVLALTGMSKPSEVQAAIQAGADAVLNKPIEPRLIIEKLTELLDHKCAGSSDFV
ncbi:MAG: response regulator transcription factor [Sulfuricellaceae bacterium]|nr:response regulator transcription factor [Sulfuricellaceae bacterium]